MALTASLLSCRPSLPLLHRPSHQVGKTCRDGQRENSTVLTTEHLVVPRRYIQPQSRHVVELIEDCGAQLGHSLLLVNISQKVKRRLAPRAVANPIGSCLACKWHTRRRYQRGQVLLHIVHMFWHSKPLVERNRRTLSAGRCFVRTTVHCEGKSSFARTCYTLCSAYPQLKLTAVLGGDVWHELVYCSKGKEQYSVPADCYSFLRAIR